MTHRTARTLVAALAGAVTLAGCTPAGPAAAPSGPAATSSAPQVTTAPEPEQPTPPLEDPPLPTPEPEATSAGGGQAVTTEQLVATHNGIAMQLHAIAAFSSDDDYADAHDVLVSTDGVPDGHRTTLAEQADGTWLTTVAGDLQVTSPLGAVGEYEPATDEQVEPAPG